METNMKDIIRDIEKKYLHFAEILNAPQKFLNFSETPLQDGGAHIEYEGNELLYVRTERGSRYDEKRTRNPDDILFWLLSDLVFTMAVEFEHQNRNPNENSRIQLFAKEEELMAKINNDWANELKMKNEKYLKQK
jgi:hypothetical protein